MNITREVLTGFRHSFSFVAQSDIGRYGMTPQEEQRARHQVYQVLLLLSVHGAPLSRKPQGRWLFYIGAWHEKAERRNAPPKEGVPL